MRATRAARECAVDEPVKGRCFIMLRQRGTENISIQEMGRGWKGDVVGGLEGTRVSRGSAAAVSAASCHQSPSSNIDAFGSLVPLKSVFGLRCSGHRNDIKVAQSRDFNGTRGLVGVRGRFSPTPSARCVRCGLGRPTPQAHATLGNAARRAIPDVLLPATPPPAFQSSNRGPGSPVGLSRSSGNRVVRFRDHAGARPRVVQATHRALH